jgi:hypothetical protein
MTNNNHTKIDLLILDLDGFAEVIAKESQHLARKEYRYAEINKHQVLWILQALENYSKEYIKLKKEEINNRKGKVNE